ncbi:hypothetical protein QA644_32885 (plasmid) [Rhizobium sp. CC1099]|uniref:hypothetical protein n=1 Tax=Rhizobium sp. CC1099 TaxID=3039160 RepID=UPI0024B12292|nr:hypothetical protein [Rhizobium sp. CC1099]WFU90720.1 hypothetical protein QA644_32885 [Rhizobium sp. CC1099]
MWGKAAALEHYHHQPLSSHEPMHPIAPKWAAFGHCINVEQASMAFFPQEDLRRNWYDLLCFRSASAQKERGRLPKSSSTKRMTIGRHGPLTVEQARKLAMAELGGVVTGRDPADDRATRRRSVTVRELCEDYLAMAEKGLVLGKGNRPKKTSTLYTDRGRINRHIVPLLGSTRVVSGSRHP